MSLGEAVAAELLGQAVGGFGAAVPLEQQVDRTCRRREDQLRVGTQPLSHPFPEPCGCFARSVPGAHSERLVGKRGHDKVSSEAVEFQSVQELRVRAPVLPALPAEPLSVEAETGGDEYRAGF